MVGASEYCALHRDEAHLSAKRVRASGKAHVEKIKTFTELHDRAARAGNEAALLCRPVPMVVVQHANGFDDKSPVVYREVVDGGVCGFAWVVVRPATSSLPRWAMKNLPSASKNYGGGLCLWCPLSTQSMEIKEAYCEAYAKVLREAGVSAHAQSRLD
jgi:hypothetical protein